MGDLHYLYSTRLRLCWQRECHQSCFCTGGFYPSHADLSSRSRLCWQRECHQSWVCTGGFHPSACRSFELITVVLATRMPPILGLYRRITPMFTQSHAVITV